jgi:magnesium chelatase subunit H
MPKPISAADPTPIRVVIVTLDRHLSSAVDRTAATLRRELPGLTLSLHAAAEWGENPSALSDARADVERADIVVANMLFMDDHIQMIAPTLRARRDHCDAMLCAMSAGEVVKLTKLGGWRMDAPETGMMALLKRLRGAKKPGGNAGAQQLAMLKRLPQILRFIPGKAQDVRAYFLGLQYFLAGSDANVANLVRLLVDRYADGPRRGLRGTVKAAPPVHYPEVGVYHPRLNGRMAETADKLPKLAQARGTVGLLVMRSYLLAGNTAHYDAVIAALEAKGLNVIPAFSGGLDARPAVEAFFKSAGRPAIDALVSLTGFSLVGGPAYNDAAAAEELLASLDVPYLAAHAIEFQSQEQWNASDRGLMPVEATMMVAIPELDGATGPIVFGGRSETLSGEGRADMQPVPERVAMLAARVARLVALRKTQIAQRKLAIVLFNFPPNAGNTGTAAFLAVFESLFNTLKGLAKAGYSVEVPASVDALRDAILHGNAARFGADANVHTRINVNDHVRRERHLAEIEAQWGPAPGRQQSDGTSLFVLGREFGNVFVGIQPGFGYEGDPMRLLFEKGFAPTHAFSAFYRFLREDFCANACLHFGTHGALEFMPGKQVGLTAQCWPDRLIGDLPNIYLYAANNPSEGTIAKRRSAATLVSYMTPPVASAGLYRGLVELKASLERWRQPGAEHESADLAELIQAQASGLDLAQAEPAWGEDAVSSIAALTNAVLELEYTLIPHGLHVVGNRHTVAEKVDTLLAVAEASHGQKPARDAVEALATGAVTAAALATDASQLAMFGELARTAEMIDRDSEIEGLLTALDGRFVRPAPGGDLLRTPAILPTGRNSHGFDPFRIPSAFAVADGAKQAARLLARHCEGGAPLPASIAIVLWGTDNLKSEGGPIAQALALMGAKPRFDGYGRLCGAELVSLEELGRPRIDVVMTLSGIFRDLLPLQTRLLAEAALLAAQADEPAEQNFLRRNALAYQAQHGCDLETAALRVFSNADGTYGANVNHLIENSRWDDEDELAETYSRRKSFAYGVSGKPVQQKELLGTIFAGVELAYQNLESVELGVTTIDQYFDTLGGISRAVKRAGGSSVPVYIGDQTRGEGTVRTLSEQVSLETRTRMLNPKWYEGMLKHGYEGVRQIEHHVANTMGWSATTGAVQPWVFQQVTQTFLLDPVMRERLAALNPTASAKLANRLIEAQQRQYWQPDEATLNALRLAGEELEDRLEGIGVEAAA